MDIPEAHGSSRELTEAKNIPIPPRSRIFPRNSALELWVAVPDAVNGQTGSPRKLTEAKKIADPPTLENEYLLRLHRLELWAAVPDPLNGQTGPGNLTEAHGI